MPSKQLVLQEVFWIRKFANQFAGTLVTAKSTKQVARKVTCLLDWKTPVQEIDDQTAEKLANHRKFPYIRKLAKILCLKNCQTMSLKSCQWECQEHTKYEETYQFGLLLNHSLGNMASGKNTKQFTLNLSEEIAEELVKQWQNQLLCVPGTGLEVRTFKNE